MILGNPAMIEAFRAGSPSNGKPFPDGARMAKIHWTAKKDEDQPGEPLVPGALHDMDFMVKDSKRFADSGGWGYAVFEYDPASETFRPGACERAAAGARRQVRVRLPHDRGGQGLRVHRLPEAVKRCLQLERRPPAARAQLLITGRMTMEPEPGQHTGADKTAIRPFRVNFPDAELVELRRRINATRWPERETVADQSQGVQLATIQALARYWASEYDWRKVEAKLNALPNSSRRSTGSTFISFTSARNTTMRCRSSSPTAGPARSSSS